MTATFILGIALYLVGTVAAIELCFLCCRFGKLTKSAAMKRTVLAAIITGLVWSCIIIHPWSRVTDLEQPPPDFLNRCVAAIVFLGLAIIIGSLALIPAAGIALVYVRLFGGPHDAQGAAPNGGPATLAGNSGVTEGPPSVT